MRYGLRMTASSLLALFVGASSIFAQTPPDQIRDWPGLNYLGIVGGLEAWSVDGSERLWMRAPDGRGLIRGDLFSAAGIDLGAALTGSAPIPLRDDPEQTVPDWSEPTPDLIAAALSLTVSDAFSIPLGGEDAPEVWAWLDLSDPSSRATYLMLSDQVEAGALSLRVIPVVTNAPQSADLMRRVLSSNGPIGAFKDLLTGRVRADTFEFDEERLSSSEGLIARIETNGALAARINPPGLPFVLWAQDTGPSAFVGVPGSDLFDGAVRVPPPPQEARPDAPSTE